MALGDSLAFTPSWAVASVTALLVVISLLLEHSLHLLSAIVSRRKRKSLSQAVDQLKSGLRSLGFISLLLTVANQPVSKICISEAKFHSFLPCIDGVPNNFASIEGTSTCPVGKLPLLSPNGIQQLQMLIMMLAGFHLTCSLASLGLGQIKMKKWERWEQETETLDHKLSLDDRRFKLTSQTKFGSRHLKFWSNNDALLMIGCLMRQFTSSVSKADYFALRRGFLNAHLGTNVKFNFQRFLRRTLDKDFKSLVTISLSLWTYVIFFLLFGAHGFYSHFWLPFIPLLVLLAIGAKLESIITEMCLQGIKKRSIISGELNIDPHDKLFWFGKPQWLLYAMQFILIENSFQLAFVFWDMYTFGYQSCLQRDRAENIITIATCIIVQFVCAHATVPLYALVSQMGSTMKETIFADHVVTGLKNWHAMAKKNLTATESSLHRTSSSAALRPLPSSRTLISSHGSSARPSIRASIPPRASSPSPNLKALSHCPPASSPPPNTRALNHPPVQNPTLVSSPVLPSSTAFEFPMLRRELVEIQKISEQMSGPSRSGGVGEASFRMWWANEITSPIGNRTVSDR